MTDPNSADGGATRLKAHLITDHGAIHQHTFVDVIAYAGEFWLVPEWYEHKARGLLRPERIIPLAKLAHRRAPPGFVVEEIIPIAVLRDEAIPPELERRYGIQFAPDIEVRSGEPPAG